MCQVPTFQHDHGCIKSCLPEGTWRTLKTPDMRSEGKCYVYITDHIGFCLDELKDLMVNALQNEGENVAKMEKADVLEVTVSHLKRLRQRGQLSIKPLPSNQEKYRELLE